MTASVNLARPGMADMRDNGFGALRLMLASVVIISHVFELLDGDADREPLTALFGDLTLGNAAVLGFFMISGYLIAASFASDPRSYFPKRALRIYPGFIAASLLCIFVVAPIGGASLRKLSVVDWAKHAANTLMLKAPSVPGAFERLPEPGALDGSMWTIAYEFRCYILAAAFGFMGLYRRPGLFALLTALVLAANVPFAVPQLAVLELPGPLGVVLGQPMRMVRLLSAFMAGTCFWLFKPTIRGRLALGAAILFPAVMFVIVLQPIAVIALGGYILFWLAFKCEWRPLRRINAKNDISYGVYLYAFPITQLLIFFWGGIHAVVLILVTFLLSLICGSLSWRAVEKPAMEMKRRLPGVRHDGRGAERATQLIWSWQSDEQAPTEKRTRVRARPTSGSGSQRERSRSRDPAPETCLGAGRR